MAVCVCVRVIGLWCGMLLGRLHCVAVIHPHSFFFFLFHFFFFFPPVCVIAALYLVLFFFSLLLSSCFLLSFFFSSLFTHFSLSFSHSESSTFSNHRAPFFHVGDSCVSFESTAQQLHALALCFRLVYNDTYICLHVGVCVGARVRVRLHVVFLFLPTTTTTTKKKVLFAFAHTLLQCSAPNFFFVVSPVTLNNTCYQRIMTEDGEAVMGKKKVVLFRTMELTGCRAILAS